MFVRCSLFLTLLVLGRVQCQTTAEPGGQPTSVSSSEYQRLIERFQSLENHVTNLVQLIGRCTFVQEFRNQLTQIRNRLSDLEAAAERNKEELEQKIDIVFAAVQQNFEAEQQKVGDGLETLRSETAQLALTVGRNITQIKEELSDVKQKTDTGFTETQENFENLEMKIGKDLVVSQSEHTLPPQYLPASCSEIAKRVDPSSPPGYYQLSAPDGSITTEYCFAQNCSEIATSHPSSPPGYYQLRAPNGTITTELCAHSCADIAEWIPSSPPGYYQLWALNGTITTEYCFANSCAEKVERDPSSPPGYYQLWTPNGTTTTEYCFANSCAEKAVKDPSSPPAYYQLRAPNGTITTEYCFANSCAEKAERDPSSPPGYYQLRAPNGTITTEYCPMECKKCLAIKSTGGWRRVAYFNMTDPTHQCPSGFRQFTEPRSCSLGTNRCISVTYPAHDIQYQRVCGRVIGYQQGAPLAFDGGSRSINSWYVRGVSLTHGSPPNRHHIWTFAIALDEQSANSYRCPCSNTRQIFTARVPDYVGDDYFCDSGTRVWTFRGGAGYAEVYTEDPLWDGSGCGPTSSCCTFNSPPWFCKELSQLTTDDIELRVCRVYYDDTHIKLIELYIQ